MQQGIHPQYNSNVTVTCACGNTFVTGSIVDEIKVEICHKCHPFYTGQKKFVDTEGKVERFERLQKQANQQPSTVSKRKAKKRGVSSSQQDAANKSLRQMINEVRSKQ